MSPPFVRDWAGHCSRLRGSLRSLLALAIGPRSARSSRSPLASPGPSLGIGRERSGLRCERLLADLGQRVGRAHAACAQRQVPVELLRADRAHLEVHHRVVRAAQLGATADVGAFLVDRDAELVGDVAGEHVALEHQLRDVVGRADRGDLLAVRPLGGHPPAVRARDVVLHVAEMPVPLERGDLDLHVGVLRRLVHAGLYDRRVVEEHRDHQERDDRVEDLDRQVVPGLRGHLVAALAVADDAPEDQAPHEEPHGQRRDDRTDPQVVHLVRLRRDALFGPAEPAERLADRAAGERRQQPDRADPEPEGATHARTLSDHVRRLLDHAARTGCGVSATLMAWRTSTRPPPRRCIPWRARPCWLRSTTDGPTRASSTCRPAGHASSSTRRARPPRSPWEYARTSCTSPPAAPRRRSWPWPAAWPAVTGRVRCSCTRPSSTPRCSTRPGEGRQRPYRSTGSAGWTWTRSPRRYAPPAWPWRP